MWFLYTQEYNSSTLYALTREAESLPSSVLSLSTQLLPFIYTRHRYGRYSHSSCLFRCCQHNCYLLYSNYACSDGPSWLSSVTVIFQAYITAFKNIRNIYYDNELLSVRLTHAHPNYLTPISTINLQQTSKTSTAMYSLKLAC